MKKKLIPFKCQYNDFSCMHIDTSDMTKTINCKNCEHFTDKTINSFIKG